MAADPLPVRRRSPAAEPPSAGGADDERAAECRRLLEASTEQVFGEPAQAVLTARRGLRLARALADEQPHEAAWVDLEALAWALVANAERVAADLDAAHAAMERAEERRAAGSGDLQLAARLLDLGASLESAAGRLDEAVRLADEAVAAYLRLGDRSGLGRALVQKAVFLAHAEETSRAVEVLHQAFEHLVPRRDHRAVLAATQCLAFCLHRMGYDIPAAQLVDQAAAVVAESAAGPGAGSRDHVLLLRLRWLKVRIQMSLGHDGEPALRQIRDELLERGLVYDAAIACLDLAAFYAKHRRLPDLQRLAREMFPVFTSRRIHREALAALLLLRDNLSSGRAEPSFLDQVRGFLERSRHDHRLRFQAARAQAAARRPGSRF